MIQFSKLLRIFLMLVTTIVIMAGCAEKQQEFVYLSWPHPDSIRTPKDPKIAYVATYHGAIDFEKKGFLDKLAGSTSAANVLRRPTGVVSLGDKIYVAETERGRVAVIDPVNKKVTTIGDTGELRLTQPLGITAAADGTLFVTDTKKKSVSVYDQTGTALALIGGKDGKGGESLFQNPVGVVVNNDLKRLYVADSRAHAIKVFTVSGELLFDFGKRGGNEGEFNFPTGIALDKRNGDLYVVDSQNHRVQVFDKDGKFIRKFGKAGDAMGEFGMPKSIALDSEGQVYVVDSLVHIYQVLSDTGEPREFYGGLGPDAAGFFLTPSSIYIDESDRIYITDLFNRVQVFQSMNEKWMKAHPEEYQKYRNAWESSRKKNKPGNTEVQK